MEVTCGELREKGMENMSRTKIKQETDFNEKDHVELGFSEGDTDIKSIDDVVSKQESEGGLYAEDKRNRDLIED